MYSNFKFVCKQLVWLSKESRPKLGKGHSESTVLQWGRDCSERFVEIQLTEMKDTIADLRDKSIVPTECRPPFETKIDTSEYTN